MKNKHRMRVCTCDFDSVLTDGYTEFQLDWEEECEIRPKPQKRHRIRFHLIPGIGDMGHMNSLP